MADDINEIQNYTIEVEIPTTSTTIVEVSSNTSSTTASDVIGLGGYIDNHITTTNGVYNIPGENNLEIGISYILTSQIYEVSSSASEINYLDLTYGPGIGEENRALVLDNNRTIKNINSLEATGDVFVGGDLFVSGTMTTINSVEVNFSDNILTVNTNGLSTGGFRVFDGTSYNSLLWVEPNNRWEFSGGNIYTDGEFIGTIDGGSP